MKKLTNTTNIIQESKEMSTDIFKNGLLISCHIGFWDGKTRQNEEDFTVQNANVSKEIYTGGSKLLIPQKALRVFEGYRLRLSNFMDRYSFNVPGLRGSRFIPKSRYQTVLDFLKEQEESFFENAQSFVNEYESYKTQQITAFNEKYPTYAGKLEKYYPTQEYIESRFCYEWMPYAWDHASIADVVSDAKEIMKNKAESIVQESAIAMREELAKEIDNLMEVLASDKRKSLGIRTVAAIKSKIDNLKHMNVFDDTEMEKLLTAASNSIDGISSFDKIEIGKTDFSLQMQRVIKTTTDQITSLIADSSDPVVVRQKKTIQAEVVEEAVKEAVPVRASKTVSFIDN